VIEQTFIHIQGIGYKTERAIWEKGILTWEDFLRHDAVIFSPARDRLIKEELGRSVEHGEDIRFFQDRLSQRDTWRLFRRFRNRAVYLDIETSGGYEGIDEITVIGLYDGNQVQSFVHGVNLEDFEIAVASYELVVTFSGTHFDLPYIRRAFPHISLPPAHVDLRFLLSRLGYKGGLKRIEKVLGLSRHPSIQGMNGYGAVQLWRAFQWGDPTALERLIRYNTADIVNLEPLMERAYHDMKRTLFDGLSPSDPSA
jgi:uncharacterized protein YprB with RNaseH-like and TPR domain